MKNFKRIAAMAAAMTLAACTAAPVFTANAADITITNSTGDNTTHTYEAYKIFGGTLNGDVLSDIVWGDNIDITPTGKSNIYAALANETSFGNLFKNTNDTPLSSAGEVAEKLATVTNANDDVTRKFADIISGYLQGTPTESSSKKISNLDDGYYFVKDKNDSGSGVNTSKTRFIVRVAGENISLTAKSSIPSVMKKVKEESLVGGNTETTNFAGNTAFNLGDGYNDIADYNIGDTVPFKLYGTLPSTYDDYKQYYYKFTDTLDKEFNYNGDAVAYITVTYNSGESSVTETYKVASGVNITPTSAVTNSPGSATILGIEFANLKGTVTGYKETVTEGVKSYATTATNIPGINENAIITVEYSAKLNTSAGLGTLGQRNKVKVTYSNNPNEEASGTTGGGDTPSTPSTSDTTDDGVIVFTYGFDINKTKSETATDKLADAYFAVYKMNDNTKQYIKVDEKKKFNGFTDSDVTLGTTYIGSGDGTDGIYKSASSGNITIEGLDAGTYYITELRAPSGYNRLTKDIKVEITPTYMSERQSWTYSENSSSPTSDGTSSAALTDLEIKYDDIDATTLSKDATATVQSGKGTVQIINKAGNTLPSTGGMGTYMFYGIGGAIAVGTGVILVSKKRAKDEE